MVTTPLSVYGWVILLIASIIMMGASLGTTYWFVYGKGHFGLFKSCSGDLCIDFNTDGADSGSQKFTAVRALCITSICLHGINLLTSAYLVLGMKLRVQSRNLGWFSLLCGISGAILTAAGVGTFVNLTSNGWDYSMGSWNYGYSFYLASFSGTSSLIAGVFAIVAVSNLYNAQSAPMQGTVITCPPTAVVSPSAYAHPTVQMYPVGFMAQPGYGQPTNLPPNYSEIQPKPLPHNT